MTKFDFLARQSYYVDHLAPIYNALPATDRGQFFVLENMVRDYREKRVNQVYAYMDGGYCGENPIVVASYGDAVRAVESMPGRQVVLMEHGVGLTFGKAAYADGHGQRGLLSLIPLQSNYVLNKVHKELRHIPHPVVGIPKMDKWFGMSQKSKGIMPTRPTLVFAFHHGDKNSRPGETGSAWEYYIGALPELARHFNIVVHSHPSANPGRALLFSGMGIEVTSDFEWVMENADLLLNDCGSAAYEFAATGRPVILLNAPWFDKKSSWGIRFWDYSDIGPQVDEPHSLEKTIETVLRNPGNWDIQRRRMTHDLFPHFGVSTLAMVSALRTHFDKHRSPKTQPKGAAPVSKLAPTLQNMAEIKVKSSMEQGILYMSFGKNAIDEMARSIISLRNTGCDLPIAVLGDVEPKLGRGFDHTFIKWGGHPPFDATKNSHFQFRAGYVKPYFYEYSPFKKTLYVDCDCEFKVDPSSMFGFLDNWEFVIAQERLMLSQLYNQRGVGWEHDISERDMTIEHFGAGSGDFPFWNSGMFMWKKTKTVEQLFKLWFDEWSKVLAWDEQKALMRAGNRSRARIFVLGEVYNYPHTDNPNARIVHLYGKGAARTDITQEKPS